jgi:membrane-bound lytic murein transglycosylase B
MKGSFAGAFGFPQFVPTSYEQWAKSPVARKAGPNLFRVEDAIFSVASYLSSNGWKAEDPASQKAALFHYNRSQDYGDTVLKLATRIPPLEHVRALALDSRP